jgi:hypothetical protein
MDAMRPVPADVSLTASVGEGQAAQPQRRDAGARWRQELERAQWALKGRREAAAAASAAPPTADSASAAAPRASTQPTAHRAEASHRTRHAAPAEEPPLPGPASSPRPLGGGSPDADAARPAGAHAAQAKAAQANRAPGAPPAPPEAPAPERVAWPRTHVHAVAHEAVARVWLRDAALGENERRRLAAEIAQRLRAAGLRLAALTVNGEEIFTMEGATSWQSKQ